MKFLNLSFEKSFGAVIFRKDESGINKYLLLKYRWGHWDFPRGHKEGLETDEETMRREIQEETGITKIKIIHGFLATSWFWYIAKGKEMEDRLKNKRGTIVFKRIYMRVAETDEQEIKLLSPREQVDFAWLSYDEAIERVTYPEARKILQKAHAFLQKLS